MALSLPGCNFTEIKPGRIKVTRVDPVQPTMDKTKPKLSTNKAMNREENKKRTVTPRNKLRSPLCRLTVIVGTSIFFGIKYSKLSPISECECR
jgi:hypothetical protein